MKPKTFLVAVCVTVASLVFSSARLPAASAPLPKATEEIVKKLKLEPSVLANIDKELEVPKAWLDGARKEGKLRIFSTFDPGQAEVLTRPFKERYPFINIEYSRASHEDRAVRTLVAYKNKKIVTDIITGLGGSYFMYKEIGALEDMRAIPNLKNNPRETVDPEGLWVGMHMRYWCMAYNTKQFKKEEMPKRWDDLLTNAKFRNGNLALGNRPQLWALSLWKANGEKWAKDFLAKLLNDVKPQLRREGMNAMLRVPHIPKANGGRSGELPLPGAGPGRGLRDGHLERRAEYQCGASIRQLVPQQRRSNRSIRRRLRAAGAQRIAAPGVCSLRR